MYTEDLYSTQLTEHTVLMIYAGVFVLAMIGLATRLMFHGASREYVHVD